LRADWRRYGVHLGIQHLPSPSMGEGGGEQEGL
jgi:hypothetical protein